MIITSEKGRVEASQKVYERRYPMYLAACLATCREVSSKAQPKSMAGSTSQEWMLLKQCPLCLLVRAENTETIHVQK